MRLKQTRERYLLRIPPNALKKSTHRFREKKVHEIEAR